MDSSNNIYFHNGLTYKCSIEVALSIIGGKWKPLILWNLKDATLRFCEIQNILETISHKVLTEQLRQLESDGLIIRQIYTEVPLKVEYSLTTKGYTFIPILEQISIWGANNSDKDNL